MAANYQLRRLKRLKRADSGAKQDTRRSTNAGDAIAEKQKKNEQKGLTYPVQCFIIMMYLGKRTSQLNFDTKTV